MQNVMGRYKKSDKAVANYFLKQTIIWIFGIYDYMDY